MFARLEGISIRSLISWFRTRWPHTIAARFATSATLNATSHTKSARYCACHLSDQRNAAVLYYFWVKTVACPACSFTVDLFSWYVFAQNAYPRKSPHAKALCPACGEINPVRFDARVATCVDCGSTFDPAKGPANGQVATCPACAYNFQFKAVRATNSDYATSAVRQACADEGRFKALPEGDRRRLGPLQSCRSRSEGERKIHIPVADSAGLQHQPGTGYNYRHWHEMFNARQLLCLSIC